MKAASALLDKPMKRAKAVDFPEADMAAADGLKQELDDAKKEREVAERLEQERIEREAAQEELKEAIARPVRRVVTPRRWSKLSSGVRRQWTPTPI